MSYAIEILENERLRLNYTFNIMYVNGVCDADHEKGKELKQNIEEIKKAIKELENKEECSCSEKDIVRKINSMCESSLDPELFDKWEEVKSRLEHNRHKLKK